MQIKSNIGFCREGKLEYPEKKTSWCRVEKQQTQPTYDTKSGNALLPSVQHQPSVVVFWFIDNIHCAVNYASINNELGKCLHSVPAGDETKNVSNSFRFAVLVQTILTNRPFYSCLLSDQAYEWLRGCR